MTEFGNRLFDARQNLGLTQKQVADEILVTAQAVSSWERGESIPNLDKLADLAILYNVTTDWLLYGTETGPQIREATENMSDRIFNEDRMYTYLKGYFTGKGLFQSLRILPYMKEKHSGQPRGGKDNIPYFSHPLQVASHAVALGLDEDDLISAALLHDVCEDCDVLPEELPVNEATKEAVILLTKSGFPKKKKNFTPEQEAQYLEMKKDATDAYYQAMRSNRIAVLVKLLDRCHNLSSMACAWTPEHQASYILETQKYIYPLMEYAKNTYAQDYQQIYLIKYHMKSVVEAVRHMMAARNTPNAGISKTNADHYLSTVFLKALGDDRSEKNAVEAAKACQKEYDSRAVGIIELRDFYDYAKEYPQLSSLGLTVVREARKVY